MWSDLPNTVAAERVAASRAMAQWCAPLASSAFRQAQIICAGGKNGRERPQPEKQDQPAAGGRHI